MKLAALALLLAWPSTALAQPPGVPLGPRFAWTIPAESGDVQGNPLPGVPADCRYFRQTYETSAGHFGVWRSGRVLPGSDGTPKWDRWTWNDGSTWVRLTVSYADSAKNWGIPVSVIGWWQPRAKSSR